MNKRLLKKAVVNAGGMTKFAHATDLSISTISRILSRDEIALRLSTASKLQQGIKLFAAPSRPRDLTKGSLTRGPSLTDQLLDVTADLERCIKPDEIDGFAAICERLLQLTVQAEQLERRHTACRPG